MRRFSLVLSLFLAAAIASAQPAKPHPAQEVLKAAIKQAESSDKTVFLIFRTDDQRSQVMSYFVKNAPKPRASSPVQDNKDAIINDLNNLAAFSFQYRIRPKATSAKGFGSVMETIDESGRMGNWTYSGQFQ